MLSFRDDWLLIHTGCWWPRCVSFITTLINTSFNSKVPAAFRYYSGAPRARTAIGAPDYFYAARAYLTSSFFTLFTKRARLLLICTFFAYRAARNASLRWLVMICHLISAWCEVSGMAADAFHLLYRYDGISRANTCSDFLLRGYQGLAGIVHCRDFHLLRISFSCHRAANTCATNSRPCFCCHDITLCSTAGAW